MRRELRTRPRAVLIAGPTASGKSALAVRLAQRCGGCVLNADAMQVYRDLAILTARPTAAEMAGVPHRLYGEVDGADTYSVSLWLAAVRTVLAEAEADGVLPIIVGGTGLYFKALTQGLSDIPPVPDEVRRAIRGWSAGRTPEALHAELARRDPLTAGALRPTDPQRVLRALEVHAATGESLKALQGRRTAPVLARDQVLAVSLSVDRPTLHARVDRRFELMIEAGALDELRALAGRELDPSLPVMRAIGVPPLLRYLSGAASLEDAISDAKAASRRYIKRQETFVRHQLPEFAAVAAAEAEATLAAAVQSSA